ncbi:MAG: enoyl-CoA hydratase/isomerase family protein, partial [Candidatus Rokubacteria bacterium]|nr:enoyl-CoA hydratase/isomerase family protein [Candidatus Rokubacteria bacterium]
MTESPVSYAARQGVAWLTLSRPTVLNALDTELAVTLAEHAERAAADPEVLLVVVRGAGRAFCSGMDRAALAAGRIGEAFYRAWIRALNCLEDMPKVSLAVLHGYSIGGGLQLAVACDLRLAVTDAVIGLGATRHGLIPDGSVLRLARLIGLGRAKELTLLNDHLDAEQARAIGLVNWVCRPEAGREPLPPKRGPHLARRRPAGAALTRPRPAAVPPRRAPHRRHRPAGGDGPARRASG